MSDGPKIFHFAELADYLGITESALRSHYYRRNPDGSISNGIPPEMKNKVCGKVSWLKTTVDDWLAGEITRTNKKAGRPRKSAAIDI